MSNLIKKKFIEYKEKIKNNKKLQFLIIVVLSIVLLFCVFYDFGNSSNTQTENDEILQYVQNLEDKLSNLLSNVKGCGKVSVAIKVDSGKETVLAMKTTTTESSGKIEKEETPIIVNGKTVVIKEMYPNITGVLIVCEGANNISVMNKILQATTSLLDVDINQIEILAMK